MPPLVGDRNRERQRAQDTSKKVRAGDLTLRAE
jgi:hypothetical protein